MQGVNTAKFDKVFGKQLQEASLRHSRRIPRINWEHTATPKSNAFCSLPKYFHQFTFDHFIVTTGAPFRLWSTPQSANTTWRWSTSWLLASLNFVGIWRGSEHLKTNLHGIEVSKEFFPGERFGG